MLIFDFECRQSKLTVGDNLYRRLKSHQEESILLFIPNIEKCVPRLRPPPSSHALKFTPFAVWCDGSGALIWR